MIVLKISIDNIFSQITHSVEEFIPRLIGAIVLYFTGTLVIRWVYRFSRKILEQKEFDPSVESFFLSFIKLGLRILLLIGIIGLLGIQTTSLAAMLAGIGVAIGSAFNGSLGNFAGGVMLVLYQPIRVGEFIEVNGIVGEVKDIGILNTSVLTGDLRTVFLPNGMLSTGIIINWSRHGTMRVDVPFSIEADYHIDTAKAVAIEALSQHPAILKDPAPEVFIHNISAGSVQLSVRPFCTQPNYWQVYNDTHSLVIAAFRQHKVSQGIPKQIMITKQNDKES